MVNITDSSLKNTDFSQNKGFSVTAEVSEKKTLMSKPQYINHLQTVVISFNITVDLNKGD